MTKNQQQTESKQKDNYYSGTLTLNPQCLTLTLLLSRSRSPVAVLILCITAWLVHCVRVDLGEEQGLTFTFACLLSLCHLGLFLLHAITAKVWHSPTGSRMQRVLALLDVLVHGHVLSRRTQRVYRRAGRESERRAVR